LSNNKHTIVALMQDRPGVLNRAVSLFRRRGFNIESLAVGHSETPGVSRKVSDVTNDPTVEREMVLVKIHAPSQSRPEVVALCSVFDAKIVDVGYNTMIIEMTGTPSKVENFVEVIRPFGVKEMMRTGRIAMVRGAHTHQAPAESAESGNGHVPAQAAALN
jgi:acetolactate synthase-1/3 small subunit